MADNTRSDRKPSLLGGDDRPADTGDEAMFLDLEVPHEADLSWVERGLLSALGVPLEQTPPTDPAGGELAVGSTGDLYYIPSGTPEKLDDSLGDQLWSRMGWDEQDFVVNVEKKQDSDDDTPL
ncbi:uncharacterized protein LOC124670717 [Lolium rigidum]|uniref:uncharacterized protein LOC124670717 n=1 Tax=Lolium rigidum TaxID=89674 RepID=UPI001F5C429F|nr:uncharacterized protein LOC124670717 [Lolium rigidum]